MTARARTLIFRLLVHKHHISPTVAAKAYPPDPALDKVDTTILHKQSYCQQVQQVVDLAVYQNCHYGYIR